MKTLIFETYSDFLKREDKDVNGVSPVFAENNPNYIQDNNTNKGCWNCSGCIGCGDCSDCIGCIGCIGCSDCSDCSGCSGCSDCSDCSGLVNVKNNTELLVIPKIENIHQTVLDAVNMEGALNMNEWHTCDTTHCRAGWVVTLAGEEGKDLEEQTSTEFAALQIYKASSDIKVYPTQFYKSNEEAMEDIIRCANEEKGQ